MAGTHEPNINAIADAGVTLGCNPEGTLYCPKDNVKRDQMASFIARALGLTPMVPPPRPEVPDCSNIDIIGLVYDAPGNDNTNPNGEWVTLKNVGSESALMAGCKLHDAGPDHTYVFPSGFKLDAGAQVKLYSGVGSNSATSLYWGNGSAVWNNTGDTATLRNPDNTIIDTYSY